MRLFKQIAILLTIFLTILLLTILTLNFQNASKSVAERLYEDAKNTATSLSLSLGTANGNISVMSIMIDANFDSGHYGYISLVDVDDELIHIIKKTTNTHDVPQWFIDAIDIKAPIASANVSAGWSPIGILNVQSDVSYAYIQLYTILKSLFVSFTILAIIGLIVLNSIMMIILKPLEKVHFQAEAAVRNEFIIEDTNIFTTEFRDVVIGMNTMVLKAKTMFDKGNEEFKKYKELEYTDEVTKLKNRKYFMNKLPEYLKTDASSLGGINIVIEITGLIDANEAIGRDSVDKLLFNIASILSEHSSQYKHSIVTKMNAAEFFILIPDFTYEDGLVLVDSISTLIGDSIEDYELDASKVYSSIGISEYSYKDRVGVLLARTDSALTHSKYLKNNKYLEKVENKSEVMNNDKWKNIINNALQENAFSLTLWNVLNTKNKKIIYNSISFTLNVDSKTIYSFGQFMLPANQLSLSNNIYKNILNMLFKTPDKRLTSTTCSLKLSYDYLMLDDTYKEMKNLFTLYASDLPFKLIIELPDKLVRKNSKQIKQYKALFENYKINIGIGEFIGESSDYQYLQDLRPIYIKADKDFFINQDEKALSSLRLMTEAGGISLIATGVNNVKIVNQLSKKDIYIIQGEATDMIKF